MFVDLKTIPEEGETFHFDHLSEELLGYFSDLIGETPFQIHIQIKLLGNSYQILGKVISQYPETCSACGYDIQLPLEVSINEILVIEKKRPRKSQSCQGPQDFESFTPSVTYLHSFSFDLKEFLHEMMATGFAPYPRCLDEKQCLSRQYKAEIEEAPAPTGHPAFMALARISHKA